MHIRNSNKGDEDYKQLKYKKLHIHNFRDDHHFTSIAFNENSTIFFIGGPIDGIQILGFNKNLKLIQTLFPEDGVFSLFYRKKSNQLISTNEFSIIIWNQDQNNLWKPNQILKDQQSNLSCQTMNNQEDLIITGSQDGKINFWKQVNSIWSCIQSLDAQFEVTCLSLNISNTKLIICLLNIIKVAEQQSNQQWIFTQIIQVNNGSWTFNFINNNQFVFSPIGENFLEIYYYEQQSKQFIKAKQIQVQRCQSCVLAIDSQFIEKKNIYIVHHSCQRDLFQIDQDDEMILQQTIQSGHYFLNYGRITNDGEYLVIWETQKFTFEVRKLQYLQ